MDRITKEVSFYRKYHKNKINVFLHLIGIPTILLSAIYGLTMVRAGKYLNLGVALGAYYCYYYSKLQSLFGVLVLVCSLIISHITSISHNYICSWSLFTLGWIMQFIGHGVFEKRAPALFDNLHQALILAPYFAVLEIGSFLGWRYANKVMARVDLQKP